MNYIGKMISAVTDTAQKIWTLTVTIFGSRDTRSARQALPFGIDSTPLPDMDIFYSQTSVKGQPVINGCMNNELNPTNVKYVSGEGETRIFSTDVQGNVKAEIFLRASGGIEFYSWISEGDIVRCDLCQHLLTQLELSK